MKEFDVILRIPVMVRVNKVKARNPKEAVRKAYKKNIDEIRSCIRGHRMAPSAEQVESPLSAPAGVVYMEESDFDDGLSSTVFRSGTYDGEEWIDSPPL